MAKCCKISNPCHFKKNIDFGGCSRFCEISVCEVELVSLDRKRADCLTRNQIEISAGRKRRQSKHKNLISNLTLLSLVIDKDLQDLNLKKHDFSGYKKQLF